MEMRFSGRVVGVDEVGRGPWAGPVVATAVWLDPERIPPGIRDSKQLSARKREAIAALLWEQAVVGMGEASVEEIDRLNILQATFLAMRRAVAALPFTPDHALVDGNKVPPLLPCSATPVIGGDRVSLSIGAASIVAKVARDRLMAELARIHPHYAWERNAGYGTATHQQGMREHGITEHHRRSFKPVGKVAKATGRCS
jgi:ribonuclease HII